MFSEGVPIKPGKSRLVWGITDVSAHLLYYCCLFIDPGMIQSGIWLSLSPQASRDTSHTTLLRWPQWRLNRTSYRKHNDTDLNTKPLYISTILYNAFCVPVEKDVVKLRQWSTLCVCAAGGSLRTFLEMMPWGCSSLLGILWAPSWFERVRQPQVKWSSLHWLIYSLQKIISEVVPQQCNWALSVAFA